MPLNRALEEFERLRQPIGAEQLQRLGRRLGTHVEAVAEAALREPELPVGLAARLADGLSALVAEATTLDASDRAIVHGALRYFLLTGDADNDLASTHGLGDDLQVFNEACRLLGRLEMQVTT